MLSTLGQPHIVCGTAGSPPRRAVGGAPALETRARVADAPPGVWAARGAGLGSRGGAAAGAHSEAGAMDPEMTREKYPCSWPKGAGNFGELSEKEVKGRINSMKTTTVDLSDGFRFRYASVTQRGFYPHDRKKANQDSFVIAHNVGHKSHHFFGVFDGHGPTGDACSLFACETGQHKRAKFPTSKAHISAVFYSFRLIFGRAIISRNGLEAWMFFLERARAEHSR